MREKWDDLRYMLEVLDQMSRIGERESKCPPNSSLTGWTVVLFIKMEKSVGEETGLKEKKFNSSVLDVYIRDESGVVIKIIDTEKIDLTEDKNLEVRRSG